jgi:hypothetical protein
VERHYNAGNYEGAERASRCAKIWAFGSIIGGIIINVLGGIAFAVISVNFKLFSFNSQ